MVPEVIADVEKYIAEKPNFSKERFAEVSGISYRTLYRFLLGEQISQKSLIAILKTVHGGDHAEVLKELAQRYPGNKSLQEAADNYKNQKLSSDADPEVIAFLRRDKVTFRVYSLLLYEEGVSREIIREEMGKMGLEAFDELLNKDKLVEVKPGCYRLLNYKQGFSDGETLQMSCLRTFELYDPDTYATKESGIGNLIGWISEEGFGESKEVLMEAGAKIIQILRKHPGRIPFSVATGLVRLFDEINFKKNSEGLS
ncbi:MAG TPA: hypothetical protein VFO10_18255 [Oligoflexus sp.]|uniref:hypothetical protein n=1 Tax=Oligoflexus sp. TaxID=1971216 RepID=UPI002D7E7426|nr:hypothetical protein [Oligoflexus sp.]HET9239209.1 hypothetical protein [Oligoflexus sp.]